MVFRHLPTSGAYQSYHKDKAFLVYHSSPLDVYPSLSYSYIADFPLLYVAPYNFKDLTLFDVEANGRKLNSESTSISLAKALFWYFDEVLSLRKLEGNTIVNS